MSIASSSASQISINVDGKEMDLEQMLDETIRGVQGHLNQLQMQLRNVACCEDRGESFEEIVEITDEIDDSVIEMIELFGDLQNVTKQIRGPIPKEYKEWFKQHQDQRKQKKAIEKLERKKNISVTKLETMQE
jgi:hypothetical protein